MYCPGSGGSCNSCNTSASSSIKIVLIHVQLYCTGNDSEIITDSTIVTQILIVCYSLGLVVIVLVFTPVPPKCQFCNVITALETKVLERGIIR